MSVSPTTTIHAAMNNELNTTVSSHFRIDGPNTQDADTALLAASDVLFYAHRAKLLLGSSNSFGGLVTSDHSFLEITMTNYRSEVLNVVLLAVYELPINSCDPSLKTLCGVIPALTKLGYDLRSIAGPQSELFQLFLKAAEGDPLSLYAVAAQHSFEELAVSASTFSLNTPIMQLSNELAQQMGAIYLQRLLRRENGKGGRGAIEAAVQECGAFDEQLISTCQS
ncbi:hypothetical protein BDV93DRAFT_592541 [Ceratobasidium sp. AG-I]|nr:hypothetical protein BDV93DRAFT_592541 [Ceratobasidium sp. AG-I]